MLDNIVLFDDSAGRGSLLFARFTLPQDGPFGSLELTLISFGGRVSTREVSGLTWLSCILRGALVPQMKLLVCTRMFKDCRPRSCPHAFAKSGKIMEHGRFGFLRRETWLAPFLLCSTDLTQALLC